MEVGVVDVGALEVSSREGRGRAGLALVAVEDAAGSTTGTGEGSGFQNYVQNIPQQ